MLSYNYNMAKAKPKPNSKYNYSENRGMYCNLTEDLTIQIIEAIKQGKNNKETFEMFNIPEQTFYTWLSRNTNSLNDKIGEARRDYMMKVAEEGLSELATNKDPRIKLETIKFISERLDKKHYSTRTETKEIDPNENNTLEPETKERLDKLLSPIQRDNITLDKPKE